MFPDRDPGRHRSRLSGHRRAPAPDGAALAAGRPDGTVRFVSGPAQRGGQDAASGPPRRRGDRRAVRGRQRPPGHDRRRRARARLGRRARGRSARRSPGTPAAAPAATVRRRGRLSTPRTACFSATAAPRPGPGRRSAPRAAVRHRTGCRPAAGNFFPATDISADGRTLVTNQRGGVSLIDTSHTSLAARYAFPGGSPEVNAPVFAARGRFAVAGLDGFLALVDPRTGRTTARA